MKKTEVSALTEWGKDKPKGVRVMASQAAVGAEVLYEWLTGIKKKEPFED